LIRKAVNVGKKEDILISKEGIPKNCPLLRCSTSTSISSPKKVEN